jgi:hypothetical protein
VDAPHAWIIRPLQHIRNMEWACGVEGWDYGLAPVYVYPASD